MGDYKFINPYNFFPLSNNAPDRKQMEYGNNSGVIEYSIMTKTPLIIPNTSNSNAFNVQIEGHKSYDFFSYNDLSETKDVTNEKFVPVIPGSEIRGMIRSNYEILTNSCLSALDSDTTMSKRIAEPFSAGVLKKIGDGKYELFKATDCIFRAVAPNNLNDAVYTGKYTQNVNSYIQNGLKEGEKINFELVKRDKGKPFATQLRKGTTIGYVIKGTKGVRKHNCHIFVPTTEKVAATGELNIKELLTVLDMYAKNSSSYKEYRKQLDEFVKNAEKNSYFPVYYSCFNGTVYLSPASITREVYMRTLHELVKDHNTCNDVNCLCPACRLFGTVIGKGASEAVASRIRFEDMVFEDGDCSGAYGDIVTLAPLSSPKLNNMEFYLKRPDLKAIFWTYDYWMDADGKGYVNDAGINGRKFYWHNMQIDKSKVEQTNLNVTVRPVKTGKKFSGRLFFENLTDAELNTLVYVLNAGDNAALNEKKHGYKLGHAKPLGYGSIAISVDKVIKKTIESHDGTITYLEKECIVDKPEIDDTIRNAYEKMTCFELLNGKNVDYPRENNGAEIFKWFINNHGGAAMKNKRNQEGFIEYIEPMQPNFAKTGYRPVNDSGNNQNRNRGQNRNKGFQNKNHGGKKGK